MSEKEMYDTFDSSGGPIQKGQGEADHRDSEGGLSSKGDDVEHGAIPVVPQKSSG